MNFRTKITRKSFSPLLFKYHPQNNLWEILFFGLSILLAVFARSISVYLPYWGIKLTFDSFFSIIVGTYYGPMIGFLYGASIDIISYLSSDMEYPYFWMYTFQAGLIGAIAGVCPIVYIKLMQKFNLKIKNDKNILFYTCFLCFFISFFASWLFGNYITMEYNRYFFPWKYNSWSLLRYIFARIWKEIAKAIIFIPILNIVFKYYPLKKIFKNNI